MMSQKFIIESDRIRRVPNRFSWLDQRLVREGRLRELSHAASALYLFLVTVADRHGMSWYSLRRICLEVAMDQEMLERARAELEAHDLVGYAEPFYQVLELLERPQARPRPWRERRRPETERPATPQEVSAIVAAGLSRLPGADRSTERVGPRSAGRRR